MCAICLGLNGNTHSLGRGNEVANYVSRDEDIQEGSIELTIANSKDESAVEVAVIKRVIRKAKKDHTSWFLNGIATTSAKIDQFTRSFNIQGSVF